MSQQLISRSPDLKRLRDEGYDITIQHGYVVVRQIPYVQGKDEIGIGTLIMSLTSAGDIAIQPENHVAMFQGKYPCDQHGAAITKIFNSSAQTELGEGLAAAHIFSARPTVPYADYYEKVITYVAILSGPAKVLDANVSAAGIYPMVEAEKDSVFKYVDTASSRADIGMMSAKLALPKVAFVGLGGTGGYALDMVVKAPVREIHLFDNDRMLQHNAFRSPGAASRKTLAAQPYKVDYLKKIYSKMRRGIFAHPVAIGPENIELLKGMSFVFLCLEGEAKQMIIEKLEEFGVPFVDVGMGVYVTDGVLGGILRVTTSTKKQRSHVKDKKRISFSKGGENEYDSNIQIADLNALNATLAVIKWKKLFGFYHDFEHEHHMTYTIDGNAIINEDQDES